MNACDAHTRPLWIKAQCEAMLAHGTRLVHIVMVAKVRWLRRVASLAREVPRGWLHAFAWSSAGSSRGWCVRGAEDRARSMCLFELQVERHISSWCGEKEEPVARLDQEAPLHIAANASGCAAIADSVGGPPCPIMDMFRSVISKRTECGVLRSMQGIGGPKKIIAIQLCVV